MGTFSWVAVGSQCTLIRIGSDVWNEVEKQADAKNQRKISNASLEFGHLYMTAGGDLGIFIAKVYYRNYSLENNFLVPEGCLRSTSLFYTVESEADAERFNKNLLEGANTYRWTSKDNHSFRVDCRRVLDESLTQEMVLNYYKSSMKSALNQRIQEVNRQMLRNPQWIRTGYNTDFWYLRTIAKELSMRLLKEDVPSSQIDLSKEI